MANSTAHPIHASDKGFSMKIMMSAILLMTMLTGHAMAQAGNAAATAAATSEPAVKHHPHVKTLKRHRAVAPKH